MPLRVLRTFLPLEIGLSSPCTAAPSFDTAAGLDPKPENTTLPIERFIARHMMIDRITPLVPTRQPATIRTLLLITKPAAHAASPDRLFNIAITTGMSPPPIGMTIVQPSTSDKIGRRETRLGSHRDRQRRRTRFQRPPCLEPSRH